VGNRYCPWRSRHVLVMPVLLSVLLLVLAACNSGTTTAPTTNATPALASNQVLTFPNVGTQDISVLDPAQGPDQNSAIAVGMIYSGLVRFDKNLNVVPDQATYNISSDEKTYTFTLKPGITFSDGTPVTAQSYVYSLTRALLPEVQSPIATLFEGPIVGANEVNTGKTKVLAGVKALNDTTLQITLTKPTAYFLQVLATSICFPLNQKIIGQYGQMNWVNHAAGNGIGTGPFMVKEWDHNVKMVLVPNPHYYGTKTKLREVDMLFVNDLSTAFKTYQAGQYNFEWNILPSDLLVAKNMSGFKSTSLLQTDLLFFNNKMPPFDNVAVRQAFAYATNKQILTTAIFKGAAVAAPTIIPPGMPGYQKNYAGLAYNPDKAKALLQSVYPDVTKVPSITFSYPNAQVSTSEAVALQQMWQTALGIQVKLLPVELTAYNMETANHQVQFGFTQWTADFPDPYDWLVLNLLSTASNNSGFWSNPTFDTTVMQAEQATGDARIALYNQAEQIAITDVGWLPLDHEAMAAVIPSWIHGVSLNNTGLYFGDWSDVYLLQH
jgi:oligopeptide transport system substrate-binding protein